MTDCSLNLNLMYMCSPISAETIIGVSAGHSHIFADYVQSYIIN